MKASFIYKLWSCVSVFQILFVVTLLLLAMLFGASDKVLFIRDSEFGWIFFYLTLVGQLMCFRFEWICDDSFGSFCMKRFGWHNKCLKLDTPTPMSKTSAVVLCVRSCCWFDSCIYLWVFWSATHLPPFALRVA